MAKSAIPQKTHHFKLSGQHIGIMMVLVVAFFLIIFLEVIPWGVSQFVVPLFQPSGERLEKTGFVKFKGLVWASVPKDIADPYKKGSEKVPTISEDMNKEKFKINKEFLFDFTFNERTDKEHGYVKGKWEFYAKSELLGEQAIILEPWIGFWILALVISVFIAVMLSILMPSTMGFMAVLFERQIDETRIKIRLQTGFSNDIVDLLIVPDDKLAMEDLDRCEKIFRYVWERTVTESLSSAKQGRQFDDEWDDSDIVKFREEKVYSRIKEYFSDFVVKEIVDTKDGLVWRRQHLLIGKGLRLYMAHHFTEKYSNNVTALAYGGAAFLIVAVGIRGLKFIPPQKPSFILLAIFLEFTMLSLLAVTMFYTEEEERMDKMLKKMEDANKSQLETLERQQYDIHQLTNALVGQTSEIIKNRVERAISEYMSSNENVEKVVAEQISKKILVALRESAEKERSPF